MSLIDNTSRLRNILNEVNALPESGGSTSICSLPLLADVTLESEVVLMEVSLNKPIKRTMLIYTEMPSDGSLTASYPYLNGKLVDMHLSEIKTGGKRWVEVNVLDGGYSKWTWADSSTGLWDGTAKNMYAKSMLVNRNDFNEIGSVGFKITSSIPIGTRVRVWGE